LQPSRGLTLHMTPSCWQSSRVLFVSVVLMSSWAWAQKPDGKADRAARAACISEATPLLSSSMSNRQEYVANLCKRPTPSTVSCLRDAKPSLVVMGSWPEIIENLCSRATPHSAQCYLEVRREFSFWGDWDEVAMTLCRRATPETLSCFREAWNQRHQKRWDREEAIRDCRG
jgi:hypothetical protein